MNENTSTSDKRADVLLVLRTDGMLLPVYEPALRLAEGWPWQIKKEYTGALLIQPTGSILRVQRVVIEKPYGTSLLAKIFSVLNSNWDIALHTEREDVSPNEVMQAIVRGLQLDRSTGRNLFDKVEEEPGTAGVTMKSASIAEIFRRLNLDDPDFIALDAL